MTQSDQYHHSPSKNWFPLYTGTTPRETAREPPWEPPEKRTPYSSRNRAKPGREPPPEPPGTTLTPGEWFPLRGTTTGRRGTGSHFSHPFPLPLTARQHR